VTLSDRLKFFGIALDASDDPKKSTLKQNHALGALPWKLMFPNPYKGLISYLKDVLNLNFCDEAGEIMVDSWLTPTPKVEDLPLVEPENYNTFITSDCCSDYANLVKRFVADKVLPDKPAMVAVDHSMTGGALKALAEHFGPENIAVLVFDNHFDGIRAKDRMELSRYAKDHPSELLNFETVSSSDMFSDVPETYNCATFLRYLLDEDVILPGNLMIIGVADYPPEEAERDEHLKKYSKAYLHYEDKGITFITKHDVDAGGRNISGRMDSFFRKVAAPHIYISLDADVGSFKSVYAARTMNAIGLSRKQLHGLASAVSQQIVHYKKTLVGFDVCEVDTYLAGYEFEPGVKDKTYEVLSDLVRMILKQPTLQEQV